MEGGSAGVEIEADDFDVDDPNAAAKALRRWARQMRRQRAAVEAASRQCGATGWATLSGMERRSAPPAVERLAALAQVESPGMKRSREAVQRQLEGFRACGVTHFEVGVIAPKGSPLPRERLRQFDGSTVAKSVGWLRKKNSEGYDIYIRPLPRPDGLTHPLAFLDDLDAEGVKRAEADGAHFAVLVESSPGRYHGWIRLGPELISQAELTAANRALARRFGGDVAATAWRQPGRLCGFTNRKPARAVEGKGQPFALLRKTGGQVAPIGAEILATARAAISAEQAAAQVAAERRQRIAAAGGERQLGDAAEAFRHARARFDQTKDDGGPDESRRDMSACMALIRAGYSAEAVEAAMFEASPDLAGRGHDPENYIHRTVERARQWAEEHQEAQAYRPMLPPGAPRPRDRRKDR
jgi:hypothetical protein